MSKKKDKKSLINTGLIAQNKKARHEYFIEDTLECGIMLVGTEVKSLRAGRASLNESYVGEKDGTLYLFNTHIPEYTHCGSQFQHAPLRPRKLLMHKREIGKFLGGVSKKGYTIVPLKLYFNDQGRVKIEIGLAKGKQMHDKRQTIKDRDWNRDKSRILRDKN